jgi:hypothetical protein
MYADSISSKVHISKAERRKYYEAHSNRYVTYPHARFAAIYAPNRKAADSLANRLKSGEKAEDILLADSLAAFAAARSRSATKTRAAVGRRRCSRK